MRSISKSLPAFLLIILLTGCVTPGGPVAEEEITGTSESAEPVAQERTDTVDTLSISTYPAEGQFRIAALSPRLQFDDDETRYALANAARQIAIYKGARVRFAKVIDQNIIGTVQDQKVEVIYDRDLAVSYLDKLKIEKESRENDYYAALVTMEGDVPASFPVISVGPGKRPEWINSPPDLEGFIFGVGVSGRRKSVYESWEQADKLAMAEIANTIETTVYSGIANIERSGESRSETASAIKTLTMSDVYLEGLYIVSRWREPDSSFYYSLAVMEKPR